MTGAMMATLQPPTQPLFVIVPALDASPFQAGTASGREKGTCGTWTSVSKGSLRNIGIRLHQVFFRNRPHV